MRTTNRTLLVLGLTLATLVCASGCSTKNSYSQSKVEAYLVSSQKGKLKGLTEGTASCPADLKLTEGMKFTCTLKIADVDAPYTVTLSNVDKHPSHIAVKPAKAILSAAGLAAFVRKNLPAEQQKASIVCGPGTKKVILAVAGEKLKCALKLGTQTGSATITVKDTAGDVELSS